MIEVLLSWPEVRIGAEVAAVRRASALKNGRNHRHGAVDLSLDDELNGVLGEIATCKFLGVYWPDFGLTPGLVDCGVCEVRAVDHFDKRLILHPDDAAGVPWVLAIVTKPPLVTLRGWIMGGAGKQDKYWSDPTGRERWAYFVHAVDLKPMAELPTFLATKVAA
jgi:hypothetical protein